jgi:lipopolysaccharide biosynthesis glycosyltransferase
MEASPDREGGCMKERIHVFTGWDERESKGWHNFVHSLHERASDLVSVTPLTMDAQRDGTNRFTYSRFLVPYLCDFEGYAIFVDGADMICLGDIVDLWAMRSGWHAVQVVKHDYKTKFPRKYLGTEMESENADYPCKNWSSVMLWDCSHYMNKVLTPAFIEEQSGAFLHRFGWLPKERVGSLPIEWNWIPGEYGANTAAQLLHYSEGIPAIDAHKHVPHAQMWHYYTAKTQQIPERRIAEVASER